MKKRGGLNGLKVSLCLVSIGIFLFFMTGVAQGTNEDPSFRSVDGLDGEDVFYKIEDLGGGKYQVQGQSGDRTLACQIELKKEFFWVTVPDPDPPDPEDPDPPDPEGPEPFVEVDLADLPPEAEPFVAELLGYAIPYYRYGTEPDDPFLGAAWRPEGTNDEGQVVIPSELAQAAALDPNILYTHLISEGYSEEAARGHTNQFMYYYNLLTASSAFEPHEVDERNIETGERTGETRMFELTDEERQAIFENFGPFMIEWLSLEQGTEHWGQGMQYIMPDGDTVLVTIDREYLHYGEVQVGEETVPITIFVNSPDATVGYFLYNGVRYECNIPASWGEATYYVPCLGIMAGANIGYAEDLPETILSMEGGHILMPTESSFEPYDIVAINAEFGQDPEIIQVAEAEGLLYEGGTLDTEGYSTPDDTDDTDDYMYTDDTDDYMYTDDTDDYMYTDDTDDVYYTDDTDDVYYTDDTDDLMYTDDTDDLMYTDDTDDLMYTDDTDDTDDVYYTDDTDDVYYTDDTDDVYYTDDTDDVYYTDDTDDLMYTDDTDDLMYTDDTDDLMYTDDTDDLMYTDDTDDYMYP